MAPEIKTHTFSSDEKGTMRKVLSGAMHNYAHKLAAAKSEEEKQFYLQQMAEAQHLVDVLAEKQDVKISLEADLSIDHDVEDVDEDDGEEEEFSRQ